jgi:hypothetical protein
LHEGISEYRAACGEHLLLLDVALQDLLKFGQTQHIIGICSKSMGITLCAAVRPPAHEWGMSADRKDVRVHSSF